MSYSSSMTKIIYDTDHLKTPNFKAVASSSAQGKDVKPFILMDEYGQTPDHFYLARKPPPSFGQVKRKLNLTSELNEKDRKGSDQPQKRRAPARRRRKSVIKKTRGATIVPEKPRYNTSLGQLTKKILKLMTDASDGLLNLNTACSVLSVPKRRLYDITNVLEGAGLIQKKSRNNIQYTGKIPTPSDNLKCVLEREIDVLESKENKLDELIFHMKSEITAIKQSLSEEGYLYVTCEDMKQIINFKEQTVLGVNLVSSGQTVETFSNKVVLTSRTSEMDSFLVTPNNLAYLVDDQQLAENRNENYSVKICNNNIFLSSHLDANDFKDMSPETKYEPVNTIAGMPFLCQTQWGQGDTVIKNAFIEEEDDIAPMGGKNFLFETEDQDLDSLAEFQVIDDYSFALDDNEGIIDLFDCQFPDP